MSDVSERVDGSGEGQRLGYLAALMVILGFISVLWVIFMIVAPIASWFPEATKEAGDVDGLFRFMLATGGVIMIYVWGACLSFALRFRRRKGGDPNAIGQQTHGNTRLEIIWTTVPALLLVVLSILSMVVWTEEHAPLKNAVQLYVHGYQFGWAFSLPDYGISSVPQHMKKGMAPEVGTVELPVNRPVYVSEYSLPGDVIHSFWVPEFRIKQDVVPMAAIKQAPCPAGSKSSASAPRVCTELIQQFTHEQFTPTRLGTYRVICTEFCGSGHSTMYVNNGIKVVSEADFVAWVRQNHGTVPASERMLASGAGAASRSPAPRRHSHNVVSHGVLNH